MRVALEIGIEQGNPADYGCPPSWEAPLSALLTSLCAPSSWRSRLWICWSSLVALLLLCVLEAGWYCCVPLQGLLVGALGLEALAGDPQAESVNVSTSASSANKPRQHWRDRVNQFMVVSLQHRSMQRYLLYTV